jgi:arsenate reductase
LLTLQKKNEVIKYLENPLNNNELCLLLDKLKIEPIELVRTKESIWIEKFKGKSLSDEEIVQTMIEYPILIERPILVVENKAFIARTLEKISEII